MILPVWLTRGQVSEFTCLAAWNEVRYHSMTASIRDSGSGRSGILTKIHPLFNTLCNDNNKDTPFV